MEVVPYKNSKQGKKEQVEEMFDNISFKYDFLNHLLSANIDKIWRKKAIKKLQQSKPRSIVDIATGTGDFAVSATKITGSKITGIDISEGMLEVGRKKIQKKNLTIFLFQITRSTLLLWVLGFVTLKTWKKAWLKSTG